MKIRAATEADRDAIWKICNEVVVAGDTYALDRNMLREDALAYWFAPGTHTYVAEIDRRSVGEADRLRGTASQPSPEATARQAPCPTADAEHAVIAGTYIMRPNQPGGGSHVANAAFMVLAKARGQGIGRAMAEHCLSEARRLGFRAMQFNFVISTNVAAMRLWQELGFKIVGTLPGAFRHPENEYVDVYVMYRQLIP